MGVLTEVKDLKDCVVHTVLLETDVRRSDFVVIFFQLTQNWTALNFEVNFRPLIQWDSRGLFSKSLMKLDDRLMTSKSERQRTSGPQKRSKSDFMYCRKFTLRPARNLKKEFRAGLRIVSKTSSRNNIPGSEW